MQSEGLAMNGVLYGIIFMDLIKVGENILI